MRRGEIPLVEMGRGGEGDDVGHGGLGRVWVWVWGILGIRPAPAFKFQLSMLKCVGRVRGVFAAGS